jgi:excisionase family DNA binding protein
MSFLTLAEVAETLRVCPATVKRLIRDGDIDARKIGTRYRIEKKVFDNYLESTKIENANTSE